MDNKELAKMTGQQSEEKVVAYKLNEIRMSGNDGKFTYLELLGEKNEEGKYPTKEIGLAFEGVIIKMRWRLFKYDEDATGKAYVISTSEYDNKATDKVFVFGKNERGIAQEVKEKYQLGSQRVLYVYSPKRDEIMRVIVKPSALTGDKNPNKEMGLFEYVDMFRNGNTYLHEFMTKFSGVERKDPKNPRKDYFAMTLAQGDRLRPETIEKVGALIKEVHEKTTGTPFADEYVPTPTEDTINYPGDEVNLEDIPF